jgi:geranylgeranyl diphosphate synthase type II
MYTFQELQEKVQTGLQQYNLPASPAELYDPMRYLLQLNGKRIRPCLLLMGANLFVNHIDPFLEQSLAIEVFHNFTLMHDDIMDEAPLRRGKPTVHAKWNLPIAILSGDAMLVEAYKLLLKVPDSFVKPVLDLFNTTATQVCEGQQMDMNFETAHSVRIDDYLQMIELKTAVLLGASLKMGGILAGAPASNTGHLYEFGKNLGIAFQLQDDLLDVYADSTKFGKQVGGDILANKKTYLLIKALELSEGKILAGLHHWLTIKKFDPDEKIRAVKEIYNQLNLSELVQIQIQNFHDLAVGHLENIQVEESRKEILEDLMETLLYRQH